MASPNALRRLLTQFMREGRIGRGRNLTYAGNWLAPDSLPGTTRVIPGETGPGPSVYQGSTAAEVLGISEGRLPREDILDLDRAKIEVLEKLRSEAGLRGGRINPKRKQEVEAINEQIEKLERNLGEEATRQLPSALDVEATMRTPSRTVEGGFANPLVDVSKPGYVDDTSLREIQAVVDEASAISRAQTGTPGTGGPISRGLRKEEEALNLTGEDRATADEIARIQAAVEQAEKGGMGEETVRKKAAASVKVFVKEKDRNAWVQGVHGRLKELTEGFDLRGPQEQGSIKSVMKEKGKELARLSESVRNTKVGSEESREYIKKIAAIDDWITGKGQPPVTPTTATDAEKIARLRKLRTDPMRNYREGDDSPIKSAILRRAIKNAPNREWYRNPKNRK